MQTDRMCIYRDRCFLSRSDDVFPQLQGAAFSVHAGTLSPGYFMNYTIFGGPDRVWHALCVQSASE